MRQTIGLNLQRNDRVQLLRAISIIAVVLIHTSPHGVLQPLSRPFFNFAVATFFFLSGYLTCIENDNWGKFFKKRILRVLIPYVIWTVLYCVVKKAWSLDQLLYNLVTAKASVMFYFILIYIQFVLLTPLIGKLAKSRYRWMGWCIAPIATLVFRYYPLLSGSEYPTMIKIIMGNCCLTWFTFYYLGIILGNGILVRKDKLSSLAVLYALSLLLQMAEGYWWYQLGSESCGIQIKLSSMLSSTLFLLMSYQYLKSPKEKQVNPIPKRIGDYSFGIFFSHMLIKQALSYFPYYSHLPFVANSVVIIFFSFILVYVGDKLFGMPYSKWLGLR